MSDHFSTHVARLKEEKGEKWASDFDAEFTYFKLCHMMKAAREIADLTRSEVSKNSGVPSAAIAKMERNAPGVEAIHFETLTKFYTRLLAERKTQDSELNTNRLGALIASFNTSDFQFAGGH